MSTIPCGRWRIAPERSTVQIWDAVIGVAEDRWRGSQPAMPRIKACPNECLGRGTCAYGFCHCAAGWWGLDCGWSAQRIAEPPAKAARAGARVWAFLGSS